MDPSQVRLQALSDHGALRQQLDGLEQAAREAADAPRADGACRALREALSVLAQTLERHLDLEDGILVPALREIDAWGEVRAASVEEEHARQRHALTDLDHTCAELAEDLDQLVAFALTFAAELRCDMAAEETDVLSANLLRDDPVTVNQTSG